LIRLALVADSKPTFAHIIFSVFRDAARSRAVFRFTAQALRLHQSLEPNASAS
jgi:hypothetical protein